MTSLQRLRRAANALYFAGAWENPKLSKGYQKKLWADLRDALDIPKGTATALGIAERK